LKAGNYFFQ